MDIKKRLREMLNEGAHKNKKGNQYGCVMVFFKFDTDEWNNMLDVIDADDLYDPKDDTGFGKEHEPHATILYGLHTDIPDEDIVDEIDKIKKPTIKLGKVSSFSNEKFDVLKFDVESEDLHKLNKKFAKFPNTNDYPVYHPHTTIAYVKPNMAKKYIKKLNNLKLITVEPDKIVYSKADGDKQYFDL